MREVVSLHVGQAGVQVGARCWELFCLEHGIDPEGLIDRKCSKTHNEYSSFFSEQKCGRVTPRAVMVDLEPSAVECLRKGYHKKLFGGDLLLSGKEDSSGIFALGRANTRIAEATLDRVRSLVEECSQIQGFFIYHSVGGGTGSGLTSLLLDRIAAEYCKKELMGFHIFPSRRTSSHFTEPYNAILNMRSLVEHMDTSIILDNEAIDEVCRSSLEIEIPSYDSLNHVIAQFVSSSTTSLRFHGRLQLCLTEFRTGLVPYPRIHFMAGCLAPLTGDVYLPTHQLRKEVRLGLKPFPSKVCDLVSGYATCSEPSILEISHMAFSQKNRLVNIDMDRGKYMQLCLMYRDENNQIEEINKAVRDLKLREDINFVDWAPSGFKCGLSHQNILVGKGSPLSNSMSRLVCLIANNTAMGELMERLEDKFDRMYRKRAYLHWYVQGSLMEESEFKEAREDIAALVEDYKDLTNGSDGSAEEEDVW